MKHYRFISFILTMLLLLTGGIVNETQGQVTYHILTKKFSTLNSNGTGNYKTDIRVEALRVVVSASDNEGKVGLPDNYKSPLLKDAAYHYYSSSKVKPSTNTVQIYANSSGTKYTTYEIAQTTPETDDAADLTAGTSTVTDGDHIYVTYDYDRSDSNICTNAGQSLKLDGTESYNIEVGNDAFFALNVLRGNRPAVLPKEGQIKNIDDITSKEPVEVTTGIYNDYDKKWGKLYLFRWKLMGQDPYNIMLVVDYDGSATYVEDNKTKPLKVAGDNISNRLWSKFDKNGSEAKMWVSYDTNYQWTNSGWSRKEGYYRTSNPIFDSFVLLNHASGSNYTLVVSKANVNGNEWQPNASKQYMHLGNNPLTTTTQLNPTTKPQAASNAPQIKIFIMKKYVFKVKTPLTETVLSQEVTVSNYSLNDNPKNHIPEALKRKYVKFTGAYKENTFTNEYTSFEAVDEAGDAEEDEGRKVIWLKYESTLPFTTAAAGATYNDLTWYNFYTNKEAQYIVRYNSSSGQFNTTGTDGSRFARTSHFAFVGDPYELKVVSRQLSESGTLNYLKLASTATDAITYDNTGTTWDIVYDDDTGGNAGFFRLHEFNGTNYLGWKYGASGYPLVGSSMVDNATNLKVLELPTKSYVYHIMRSDDANSDGIVDGVIAAKATISQETSIKLDYTSIPEIIRSPFLGFTGVTLSFYESSENAIAGTSAVTYASDTGETTQDIWVRYNMSGCTDPRNALIAGSTAFNVRLNGEYIYYDATSGSIKSVANLGDNASNTAYQWYLGGSDPYAMTIKNGSANKFVTIADGDSDGAPDWADGTISWSETTPNSKFIIKSAGSTNASLYEVMAATGDGVEATTTYYNIGRPTNDPNTIKVFSKSTYEHGYQQLSFQLSPTTAKNVTYHLIDKYDTDLLQIVERHIDTDEPYFPDVYRSPLVETYHYYTTSTKTATVSHISEATDIDSDGTVDIYVFYDTSNAYDLTSKKTTYLLKFNSGTPFYAEDGSDGLEKNKVTPIYPYCNGDCNFFVYGQAQYDLQQQGAASTRTRWAWYLESAENDPYHVKICSRQQETYNGDDLRGYFCTFQPIDYDKIVTTLVWPNISGIQGTEYMILGSPGLFRLETTNPVALDANFDGTPESSQRYIVKSFEQYWKTFDTIKKKLLKNILEDKDKGNSKFEDPDGSIIVPTDPTSYRELLTGTGEGQYGYHSYSKWAYAKRFSGYNKDGKASKGWEEQEHWFETVEMGEGYFKLEEIDITPVLILLDQHGWEIMRKPLPTSPDDPTKAAKYDEIRPYDSPMVKNYYFWTKASKRTGFHQYYNLSQQVTVDGEPYTSQSLTDLPPYETATNLRDAKGNQYDEYVTYTVKDEYVKSYDSSSGVGQPFIIQQGDKYASYDGSSLSATTVPTTGGMKQYIIDNISDLTSEGSKKTDLWYVKPNARIDYEMGYIDADEGNSIATNHDWTDAEGYTGYTGVFSDGFDPYNIQISSVPHNSKYFVTNATEATLANGAGSLIGLYSDAPSVSIREPYTNIPCSWYDSRALAITNATFMAVQDANGNMQLMPRFDHANRMKGFSTLVAPSDPEIDQSYTQLFRSLVYYYHIIDNEGSESLRYKSGGDLLPQTPNHFKSPLAKGYTYYSDNTCSTEITSSFASAGLTTAGSEGNNVYVRYSYNEDNDNLGILQGRWLTMTLNNNETIYSDGIKEGTDKPETIDGDDKKWQWKFLKTPQTEPDPYSIQLFNRSNAGADNELPTGKRFALLSHTADNSYALIEARTENTNYNTYLFLNGNGSMSTNDAATISQETGFLSSSCNFNGTNSQIKLTNEVEHTYTYKIYTNSGVFAISETQENTTVVDNQYVPELPEAIRTPLLNADQFRYYEQNLEGNVAENDTLNKALVNLYGLYDDIVYVHYTDYNPLVTTYKAPNERNATNTGQVEKSPTSNDASIDLKNELLYNIIWYNDNIMTCSDGDEITDGGSQELMGDNAHEWQFDGEDPYAITIHSKLHGKYVFNSGEDNNCLLANTGTSFMLLPKDGYDYGVLQVTGDENGRKLTGYGQILTASAETDPTRFIIFLLSTHKVTYHLLIANTGVPITIEGTDITYNGTTQRNLTNNPIADVPVGHISLGDQLKIPAEMYRPNVTYEYYVGEIWDVYENGDDIPDGKAVGDDKEVNNTLTNEFVGQKTTTMGRDDRLLGKHVKINIRYKFTAGLETNAGDDFVKSVTENKWYTFESKKADETPLLAQFTNAWGMEVKEGRGTHYTNDYLWTPVGDPYGFKMYHRYTYVNSGSDNAGEKNRVMTTIDNSSDPEPGDGPFAEGKPVTMGSNDEATASADPYCIYELLADENTTPGYFKIHPVANSDGTQYYFKIVRAHENPLDDSTPEHDYVRLSSDDDYTEFNFGLSEDMVKPYYDRAGYIGGLNEDGVNAYKAATNLMEKQAVVYNSDNIIPFTPGYYRLHSPEDISGITTRYASGYTHKTELDYDGSSEDANGDGNTNYDPLPMHFYERKGVNTTFEILGINTSPATRGAIPISEPAYDPSSIFYIYRYTDPGHTEIPYVKMKTQNLFLKGKNWEYVETKSPAIERAPATMTDNENEATPLFIMDIGGAIMLIHDNNVANRRSNLKYLSFDQNDNIYDLKLTNNTHTDHAKWLLEPANKQGLTLAAHSGLNAGTYGTTYYNVTFCAPFDVLVSGTLGKAYTCVEADSPWPITGSATTGELHPKPIGAYNTSDTYETYAGNNNFVPAGTPVIISSTDNTGTVKLTIPTTSPSTSISTIFSAEYLEQMLDGTNVVYSFGLPFTSELTMDENTGNITGTLPQQAERGMGFFINANPNKEADISKAGWTRNNRYVINNKIYYRAAGAGAPAMSPEFVPVVFDDGEQPEDEELQPDGSWMSEGDGCIYDLQGRKVATKEQVMDGKWRERLSPGIYILNGRKFKM